MIVIGLHGGVTVATTSREPSSPSTAESLRPATESDIFATRLNFERWQLTAVPYSEPDGWRQLFAEAGDTGDDYWTTTE